MGTGFESRPDYQISWLRFFGVSSLSPENFRDRTSYYTAANFFHFRFSSFFTAIKIIRRHVLTVTDGAVTLNYRKQSWKKFLIRKWLRNDERNANSRSWIREYYVGTGKLSDFQFYCKLTLFNLALLDKFILGIAWQRSWNSPFPRDSVWKSLI
jgi:hypothetical protein